MGDRLVAIGSKLAYMLGLGFILRSRSDCCCTGPQPCGCTGGNGCLAGQQLIMYHAVKTDVNSSELTYVLGPQTVECCCRPPIGMSRNYTVLLENYATSSAPLGRVTCRTLTEGSGSNGSVTVRTRHWQETGPAGSGLVLLSDETWTGPVHRCDPFMIVLPHSGPCSSTQFGARGTTGFEVNSCSRYDADFRDYFPDPISGQLNRLGIRYRATCTVSADYQGCIGTGCRTCCLPDDTCVLLTPQECRNLGGRPGEGTDCGTVDCGAPGTRPVGACCLDDGTCIKGVSKFHCESVKGGVYQGDDSTCETVNCPPAPRFACCGPDGFCAETTQAQCLPPNTWAAPAHCVENPCPQLPSGACCLGLICQEMTEPVCATNNGRWMGAGTTCTPGICDCTGACCRQDSHGNRYCEQATASQCTGGSIWYGCGSTCEQTNNCTAPPPAPPPPGALGSEVYL